MNILRKPLIALWVLLLFCAFYGGTRERVAHAQQSGGIPFNCVVTVSTTTSLAAVGGDCGNPTNPAQSLYITSILSSANAAGIAADSFNTLKAGSGTTCATGTTIVWGTFTLAATQDTQIEAFPTPITIPPGQGLCWINSTAGSKFWVITGFIR